MRATAKLHRDFTPKNVARKTVQTVEVESHLSTFRLILACSRLSVCGGERKKRESEDKNEINACNNINVCPPF